ncbi:MAG: ribulose-phosphate 3-epimerase [Planctomycetes bacterium]|nr:ribulose-phosphate 3-epimerase [Planctomycetota bacterium]MBL7142942.1 ribulose-phosphate 3-epimerase [Phycisphaerae bacterium]
MPDKPLLEQIRKVSPLISVGVLTADLMSLGSELKLMDTAGVKLLHVDVMDGCFCPMMTVGPAFIKALKTPLLKDIHLMIEDPLDKLESYVAAGADMITVHVESCRHIHRVLQKLREFTNTNDPDRGILRGIALNPGTPLEVITPLIDELEMFFLLAVNPGWGGQKFIPSTQQRLSRLRQMISDAKKDILVGVDGGITRDNIADVARMDVDIIVTGSAVFDGKAPLDNARFMMDAVSDAAKKA